MDEEGHRSCENWEILVFFKRLLDNGRGKKRGLMEQLIEDFLQHLRVFKHASIHTLRNYSMDLRHFQEFIEKKQIDVHEVHRRVIREYLSELSADGLKKKSIQRKVSTLRSFFRHHVKFQKISVDPMEHIEPMKQAVLVPKALTIEEIKIYFSQPNIETYLGLRDRVMFELLYSSGLRVSELQGLNRESIDFDQRLVSVLGKGNKVRIVPITQNCSRWLKTYLDHPERNLKTEEHDAEQDHKAVFLNRFGKRITTRSIDRLFKEYLLKSGLSAKITPHVIRHSIATHWLENGMNLKIIQEILGHESLATTQIYTKVTKGYKIEGYSKAHPLMKKDAQ
jgi:integrase/recombinase XerC